jgi:D-3-phosphoglycerate dehydrogenase
MDVLIADKMAPQVVELLEGLGCSLDQDASLKDESLLARLQETCPSALIVRSTKVTAAHIDAGPGLALIIRAGAGVNTIDLDRASARGVYVANCPGKNAAAVAELTIGHMLNADRRIADNVAALRDGRWEKKTFAKGARGIQGRTIGIIGMGAIGQEVAKRARAFGMQVAAFDPALDAASAEALDVASKPSMVAVAKVADVLTVHVGLSDHTRGMIDREVLGALRKGATFINTSRGPVVDEDALLWAIQTRSIKAGLDVFCGEPASDGAWSTPLANEPGVYGTHHIGASTDQASEAVGDEVVRIVKSFMETGSVPNCVNLATRSHASHLLVVRHADEVGVLAGVLDKLRRSEINVQEMANIVFRGALAATAHIQVAAPPSADLLAEIEASSSVFAADLKVLE